MKNLKKLSVLSLAIAGLLGTIQANAAVSDTAFFRVLPMVIVWGADAAAENTPTANPVASDFLLLGGTTGTAATDMIPGNVFPVVTGTLAPAQQTQAAGLGSLISITSPAALPAAGGAFTDNATTGFLNAGDAMTAFGIQSATNVNTANTLRRSFYVASNAKFDIFALSGSPTTAGDFALLNASNISWSMAVTTSGTDGTLAFGANAQDPSSSGTGVIAPTTLSSFATSTKVFGGGRRTAFSNGGVAAQSVRFDVTYGLQGGYNFSLGSGSISVPVTYTVYNP